MKHLMLTALADINESLRSRWFLIYSLIFGGIIVALFITGLTESRVMGFTGLSRLLVTYLQITMAILPVFVLLTTVRSVAGDREAGVFEYLLSLPVGLAAWYWGKMLGRFIVVFLPVILAMMVAVVWAALKGAEIPWSQVSFYTGFLIVLAWCFLGIGMLISSLARSADVAQGTAFMVWLFLLLFLDLILLGVIIKGGMPAEGVIAIDWERAGPGDPAADLGRLIAEVTHSVVQHGGSAAEAAAYIDPLCRAYTLALPDEWGGKALQERARFYQAISTLRMARNGWLSRLHRTALVARAMALLT